jgi:hypothetical protein
MIKIVSEDERRGEYQSANLYKKFTMTRNTIQLDEFIHLFFSYSFKRVGEGYGCECE